MTESERGGGGGGLPVVFSDKQCIDIAGLKGFWASADDVSLLEASLFLRYLTQACCTSNFYCLLSVKILAGMTDGKGRHQRPICVAVVLNQVLSLAEVGWPA